MQEQLVRFVEFNDAKQDVFSLAEPYRARLAVSWLFDLPMFDGAGRGAAGESAVTASASTGLANKWPEADGNPAISRMDGRAAERMVDRRLAESQERNLLHLWFAGGKKTDATGVAFAGKRNGLNVP